MQMPVSKAIKSSTAQQITRSVCTKPMTALLKEGTVVDLKLASLKKMVQNLTLTLVETQTYAINVKLSYSEQQRSFLCHKKQSKT
jgi:hypothetical protein